MGKYSIATILPGPQSCLHQGCMAADRFLDWILGSVNFLVNEFVRQGAEPGVSSATPATFR